ncbi:MAG: universal stress protein [Ectothiorhodospiraceae bacterium]|nr:universal stress protein [Ectothiorhodospiraceae bacterium]MCH8506381.1 universal stress protein [Ectothiorhodospiraceae bacterium]
MATVGTIVVPCDGSEHSAKAAEHAALLAVSMKLPVHLLHVSPSHPRELFGIPGPSAEMVGIERIDEQAFQAIWDTAAQKAFDTARKAMGDATVTLETVRSKGDPSRAIIDYAASQASPMIVIGRRGLGRFQEALLGSVSQRVLHWADCPVLVVH